MNLLGGAFLLLGGVMFPIEVLPEWMQTLSNFIPLTYGLEGMRLALLQGYGIDQIINQIMILGVFSLVLITVGIFSFNWSVWLVKDRGSLTQF